MKELILDSANQGGNDEGSPLDGEDYHANG